MQMKDELMNQLTFKQFFKAALLIFPAVGMYVFTMVFGKMEKNNLIISLFLMLLYAFVYVIILYIVYTKMDFEWYKNFDNAEKKVKKGVLYSIYEIRIAIRLIIMMYAFTSACKTMMLNKYNDLVIVIPFVIVMLYLSGKGLKGYVCFLEAIFWGVVIAGLFIAVFCVRNFNMSQMLDFVKFQMSDSVTETIQSVLIRGYTLLIAFSMMEFVMMLYVRVKNRRRGMLFMSVGTSFIVSVLASFFVIAILGWHSIYSGTKSILNIVGAFELPNGGMARIGILAGFLLMAYSIAAIQIHFVAATDVIDGFAGSENKSRIYKCLWGIAIIFLYMIGRRFLSTEYAYEIVVKYMAVIDIPLSIIIPALMGRKGEKSKKILAASGVLLITLFVSGCTYKSIEDVDYATVIVLDKNEDKESDVYNYTFVIDTLETKKSDEVTEQLIWETQGEHFEEVRDIYNDTHNHTLDLSHVEYLVVSDEDMLSGIYPELMNEFATKYIDVIYEKDLMEKADEEDIRAYLKAHYKGKCLAAIDMYDEDK